MAFVATESQDQTISWLGATLPDILRRILDCDDLEAPLLQLPVAQLRLAQALFGTAGCCGGDGETMGHLSERLSVRQSALTQAADRLIGHGLAERLNDRSDRRVVRLRLTPKGRTWIAERKARRQERIERLWELLDPGERQAFEAAVHTLQQGVHRLDEARMTTARVDTDREPVPPRGGEPLSGVAR